MAICPLPLGLTVKASAMLRSAPPPFGSEGVGASMGVGAWAGALRAVTVTGRGFGWGSACWASARRRSSAVSRPGEGVALAPGTRWPSSPEG